MHLVIDDIDLIVRRFNSELNFVKKTICPRASNGESKVQVCIYSAYYYGYLLHFIRF